MATLRTSSFNSPHNIQWLRERGISEQVIRQMRLNPVWNGVEYPIFDEDGNIQNTPTGDPILRFKRRPGGHGDKYLWRQKGLENRPRGYPSPALRQAILDAQGLIYLASGEPDVWAYMSAGISNATSVGFGESQVRGDLEVYLHSLNVTRVIAYPDLDDTGKQWGQKIVNLLGLATIEVNVLSLPESLSASGDINKAWMAYDFNRIRFNEMLQSCPRQELRPRNRSLVTMAARPAASPEVVERQERAYALSALTSECTKLAATGKGSRNKHLFKSAAALGGLIGPGRLHREEVERGLEAACDSNGLVADEGLKSVRATIKSGIERGFQTPRDIPALKHSAQQQSVIPSIAVHTTAGHSYWRNGIPSIVRRCILTELPPLVAPVVELRNVAIQRGLLQEAEDFTVQKLFKHAQTLGWDLPSKAIARGLQSSEGMFFQKLDTIDLLIEGKDIPIESKNEKKSPGRPSHVYRALPVQQALQNLSDLPKTTRRLQKRKLGKQIICRVKPEWFVALGHSAEEAEELASIARECFAPIYRQHRQLRRYIRQEVQRIQTQLLLAATQEDSSVPLPVNRKICSARDYRAAVLRAEVEHSPDESRTRIKIADMLGIGRSSVKAYLDCAGLRNEDQYVEITIPTSATDVARWIKKEAQMNCGYARRVHVRFPTGKAVYWSQPLSKCTAIEKALRAGARITLFIQIASIQRIDAVDQPAEETEPSPNFRRGHRKQGEPRQQWSENAHLTWVVKQLALGLAKITGCELSGGQILNPSTGEILAHSDNADELIALLRDQHRTLMELPSEDDTLTQTDSDSL